MKISEKLKVYWKSAGLTQKKLAEISGIAEITIRQYEADKYDPGYKHAKKLAAALGVHPTAFLSEEDVPDEEKDNVIEIMEKFENCVEFLSIWKSDCQPCHRCSLRHGCCSLP